jgi:hypothetical protein
MLAALDFPFQVPGESPSLFNTVLRCPSNTIPVGDLSSYVKGASERQKLREDKV